MSKNPLKPRALEEKSESFGDLSSMGADYFIGLAEKYNLSLKLTGTLLRETIRNIEAHYLPATQNYVRDRLEEQVNIYIAKDFHEYAGCTKNSFRLLLAPLIDETLYYFAPPARLKVVRGQFTVLLVLPPQLVPLRRQIMTLMGESAPLIIPDFEAHTYGKESPKNPYVLVGIDGGRKLRDLPIIKADGYVALHGYTYFAFHELIQLLLVRPEFLRSQCDVVKGSLETAQTSVLVLGEKCPEGIVKLNAEKNPRPEKGEFALEFVNPANILSGAGLGKPYYTRMITCKEKK